jgi:hypothetical protein
MCQDLAQAGFEKLFMIASILEGFHEVEGKYKGTGEGRQYLS